LRRPKAVELCEFGFEFRGESQVVAVAFVFAFVIGAGTGVNFGQRFRSLPNAK